MKPLQRELGDGKVNNKFRPEQYAEQYAQNLRGLKQAEQLGEAVEFFRQEAGFKRLMELFIKNYYRLGGARGSVKLSNLTSGEKEALSGIMGKDYRRQSSATISLAGFQQALEKTRFTGIGIRDLLTGYLGKDLTTRCEEEERYFLQKEAFFQNLHQKHCNNYCRMWLNHIQKKGAGTRGIHSAYEQNSGLLSKQLDSVLMAVQELCRFQQRAEDEGEDRERNKGEHKGENRGEEKKRFERLPVFASRISGDPHGFDLNKDQGRFLISALLFIRAQAEGARAEGAAKKTSSLSAEEATELLASFGLIRDDLLNFVTCAGILAFRGEERVPVAMWQNAWEDGAVLNVPLREIARISDLEPAKPAISSNDKREKQKKQEKQEKAVFVVENSGVFSEILEGFRTTALPPLICTHGQFKLAALLMLDILVKNNTVIYYSGDFDPEGLQIAQRLLQRYPNRVRLWRYGTEEYCRCISEVVLSEPRLKKLRGINNSALAPLKVKMQTVRKAGYQEQLVHLLVDDICNYM